MGKQHIKAITVLLALTTLISCKETMTKDDQEKSLELWYDKPATSWMTEALPIGNAYMAAMFFGGVDEERIQFNEESLWAGGKGEWEAYNGGNREGAYKYLPKVRELLNKGDFDKAHQLATKELTGIIKETDDEGAWIGFGAYQTFGDIMVEPAHQGEMKHYRRSLDITNAIGKVSYTIDNTDYKREYFASYPARTLVFRFSSNNPDGTDYDVEQLISHAIDDMAFQDNQLIIKGHVKNNNMAFESRMFVDPGKGNVSFNDGKLQVKNADTLTLYLTAATDYVNDFPKYKGRDYNKLNAQTIANLNQQSYSELLQEHQEDYKALFKRVSFSLGDDTPSQLPLNERLAAYTNGTEDLDLETLFFQYGRYLLISSSRPGSLPANLQGKWNDKNVPEWAADYHTNINVQMIYWPAEITNLAECHEPLMEYIDKLREPGRKTAKTHFNSKGWVVNTMNNAFGFTAPGWDFPWGYFPGGAAWLSRHCWEHYTFNRDKEYLRREAYPIMKEAALFWLDYLTMDEEGFLVSSPSYSPEHGGISKGAYMDIQIVWDLFANCIAACDVLGTDADFKEQLKAAKAKLLPLKIGRWGQLQEWKEDVDDPKSTHRHVSHLYALYPGYQINANGTPEFFKAAQVSLDARGDHGTGWSIGWKVNFHARLKDGNRAYKLVNRALQRADMGAGSGVYGNLLSTHPPFQLDGNMGATSGIAEMLLQSHDGEIQLLPALPDNWSKGKIIGLKARGNFEVSMEWDNGVLKQVHIRSLSGEKASVRYGDKTIPIAIEKGSEMILNHNLEIIK